MRQLDKVLGLKNPEKDLFKISDPDSTVALMEFKKRFIILIIKE